MPLYTLEALVLGLIKGIKLSTHLYLFLIILTHKQSSLLTRHQANFIIRTKFSSLALRKQRPPFSLGLQILF